MANRKPGPPQALAILTTGRAAHWFKNVQDYPTMVEVHFYHFPIQFYGHSSIRADRTCKQRGTKHRQALPESQGRYA